MNFTSDIKKEIINRGMSGADGLAEKKACVSAFIRTSGTIGVKEGKPTFFIVSETEPVAEFICATFSEIFATELSITRATMDRMSGRDKLIFECPAQNSTRIVKELGLLKKTGELREGIASSLLSTENRRIAYIQGAFLGGGSCTIPAEGGKSGYHLEIVFSDRKTAREFCGVLEEFELIARLTERKETQVAYIKSKEQISDFLSVIGAVGALKKFSALVEKRDEANRSNRAQNCMAGNADKTAIAAVKQVVAIQTLIDRGGIEELSEELKTLAKLRVEQPSKSLQELADMLKVSKSCLNHRMRKLMAEAEKKREERKTEDRL